MSAKSIFCLSLCLTCFSYQAVLAQSWLNGYNYRKKITIDKSRIKGNVNLVDFPFLITVVDPDLVNLQHCDPKLTDPGGLDISFCLASQPTIPIAFQLDSYDPALGKLTCWIRLEQVFAGSNAGNNALYLYYGSNVTADPFESQSTLVWTKDYDRLWHMNPDLAGKNLRSANGRTGKEAIGSASIQNANFTPGKIGTAVRFNGVSDAFSSPTDTNTTICITAWVKPKSLGKEQVIVANDSLGGYQLSLNEAGHVVFDIMNTNRKITSTSSSSLLPGSWNYIAALFSKGQRRLLINGLSEGSGTGTVNLIAGGRLRIGCSKIQDKWFEGEIDELRIESTLRSNEWISTAYLNQNEPALAYSISTEERNPVQSPIAYEFTAQNGSQLWADGGNWKYGKVPPPLANVTVKSNQVLRIGTAVQINKLLMETGAMLYPEGELSVNCLATIGTGAVISIGAQSQVSFWGDVMNNGNINGAGTMLLTGAQFLQTLSGTGMISISTLAIQLPDKAHVALLQTDLQIKKTLKMIRGTLNANGKLSLLADAQNGASVWPIDLANTALTGLVNVQQFIAGSFSAPATARGWRLLSSPVYHNNQNNLYLYGIQNLQERVFVTGPAGARNGFDPSVNNSSTIYIHNQALPGTLSQKYTGIANTAVQIPFGRGIYLFSRGDRAMPEAYARQIQGPAFVNPEAYIISHRGFLFSGELMLNLESRNTGDPGDGFNLLGNPYAAPIVWSRLPKVNTGPFIWTFNPENNAYRVTDDPDFIIPAGTGFFIRLNSGQTNGSLTFTEQAKYMEPITVSGTGKIQSLGNQQDRIAPKRLHIQISKGNLSDNYTLIYSPSGDNRVTDADAAKIGAGYLSISSITTDNQRLAIEDRAEILQADTINLSVQVWAEGACRLSFTGLTALNVSATLIDHELHIQRQITAENNSYDFNLNPEQVKTGEIKRFSILLQPVSPNTMVKENEQWRIYPNPFADHIYISSQTVKIKRPQVQIRNVMGEIVYSSPTAALLPGQTIEIKPGPLSHGIYILSVLDQDQGKITFSHKLIKSTP